MILSNKELKKMLKEQGRKYTLTMYVNRFFHLTGRQLEYAMNYKRRNYERKKS